MSEPLSGVGTWRPVMRAAGYRCQCTGQCGNPHAKSDGRCPREHDAPSSKRGHLVRLLAAPADPLTPPVAAASLPAGELRAWCPECHSAAVRAARRAKPTVGVPGLFDL